MASKHPTPPPPTPAPYFYMYCVSIYMSLYTVRTCTNTDFRTKVSSTFTLSLLLNIKLYVSLWARPISLIYDVQHLKRYHVNCLFNHFLMEHSIFVSDF